MGWGHGADVETSTAIFDAEAGGNFIDKADHGNLPAHSTRRRKEAPARPEHTAFPKLDLGRVSITLAALDTSSWLGHRASFAP